MNPGQYRRADQIYHAALDLPPERRTEFLERSCAGDQILLSDVESLLAAQAEARQFIEASHQQVGRAAAVGARTAARGPGAARRDPRRLHAIIAHGRAASRSL